MTRTEAIEAIKQGTPETIDIQTLAEIADALECSLDTVYEFLTVSE